MFSKKNYAVKNLHFKNHLLQVYIPREKSLHQIPQFSGENITLLLHVLLIYQNVLHTMI